MTTTANDTGNRFARQDSLVPRDRITQTPATVIGVGAIGRQVAIQLASIGCMNIQLVDFDVVDETNITTQGYRRDEVGRPKVEALRDEIIRIDGNILVSAVNDMYRHKHRMNPAIFCCVDKISVRSTIYEFLAKRNCRFFVDGRMSGEVMKILAVDSVSLPRYKDSLFAQDEAQAGACTAKSTIYTASIAAGLMVHQYTRFLRELPLDFDTTLNLLAGEMSVE